MRNNVYHITVNNWDKHNPKSKKGFTHFMVSNRFFDDHKILTLTCPQRLLFLSILALCSDHHSSTVHAHHVLLSSMIGLRHFDMTSALDRLQENQLLTWTKTSPLRIEENRIEENRIEENRILAHSSEVRVSVSLLEAAYQGYPKKKGKSRGLARAKVKIKTKADLDNLHAAIENYKAYCAKSISSEKYIMQFDTFMNEWQDWLDPENGSAVAVEHRGADLEKIWKEHNGLS